MSHKPHKKPKSLKIQNLLDFHYNERNHAQELCAAKPDPLFIAKQYVKNPHFDEIALCCALLSYGNARAIVGLLSRLDFSLLSSRAKLHTTQSKNFPYYRFQTREDIYSLFEILGALLEEGGLKHCFLKALRLTPRSLSTWEQSHNQNHAKILYALYSCIERLHTLATKLKLPLTQGLSFALGTSHKYELETKGSLTKSTSPLKRWNMLLRWLVREDCLDIGCWKEEVDKAHLILPLDTHTFRICLSLGLIKRKSYDIQSALEASDSLSLYRPHDPIAYDFALYRIGQEKIGQEKIGQEKA